MARIQGSQDYVSFVQGIITEASPLTYPENASIDEANFILNRDGSRQRRLGFDLELSATHTATQTTYAASDFSSITTHKWSNVNNNPQYTFVAIQYGKYLYIFNTNAVPISGNYLGYVELTLRSGGTSGTHPIQTASGNGVLIIVGADFEPQYIEASYSDPDWTFTSTTITTEIRDLIGVYEDTPVEERPTTLTPAHEYNLANQGWGIGSPAIFYAARGVYPGNIDLHQLGWYVNIASGQRAWSASEVTRYNLGATAAPKGKYIIDAFSRSSSRELESGVSGLSADIEYARFTTTTYHSGRAWYSGVNSDKESDDITAPNYNGYLFYTQILTDLEKLGKCYQEADPTSEEVSDLVATDGGTLQIPEIESILKLISIGSSLIIVATNGVWEIKSGETGFRPDDYIINKITEQGALSQGSIVLVEGRVAWWNKAGIYILEQDQVSQNSIAQNLSEGTIQTLFEGIDDIAKTRCTGIYDDVDRKVKWMYSTASGYDGLNYKNSYNKELVYDIVLKAWTVNTISPLGATVDPLIAGYIPIPAYIQEDLVEAVTDGGVAVTDDAVAVTDTSIVSVGSILTNSYLILSTASNAASGAWRISMGGYNDSTFTDWATLDGTGVDYTSYLVTGYDLFGSSTTMKQVPYIFFHFTQTEDGFTDDGSGNLSVDNPSSCNVRSRWDFADSSSSGKWGTSFEAYRLERPYFPSGDTDTFDYGKSVVTTKHSLRGSGKALSLYIASSAGKDMQLLGWSILVQGTDSP